MRSPIIKPLADRGLILEFDEGPSTELTRMMSGLCTKLLGIEGVIDAAPGHRTSLIEVQPERRSEVMRLIPELIAEAEPHPGILYNVELLYDGPDLEWSLDALKVTLDDLVDLHSGRVYDVRLLGSPGFVYLSEVHPRIALPRKPAPDAVQAGAVGIGGRQTGIYGRDRPGGWRILASVESIPRLHPGDRVRFLPR